MGIETFGGGEALITSDDSKQVTFAIMVNVELRSEDRELTVPRPLYEYPLLKRLYKARGGSARIDPNWLIRKNGTDAIPRHVPLSKNILRVEAARLQREFRIPMQQGGWHSFFKDAYGEGSTSTFYAAVAKLAKGYIALRAKVAGEKRGILVEEWEALASSIEPQAPEIDVIESIEIAEMAAEAGLASEAEIDDPIARIQDELMERGWEADVALAVVTQHAAGTAVDAKSLNLIAALSHKPKEIQRLYDDYRAIVSVPALAKAAE